MAQITLENPEVFKTVKTDKQGRVYLGTEYAETEVSIAAELVDKKEG